MCLGKYGGKREPLCSSLWQQQVEYWVNVLQIISKKVLKLSNESEEKTMVSMGGKYSVT